MGKAYSDPREKVKGGEGAVSLKDEGKEGTATWTKGR